MRVLMTTDAVGGVWDYALQLTRLLATRGVEVLLAAMGPPPSPAQAAEARSIPGLRLCTRSFALEWMPDPWLDVDRAGEWLLKLEDAFSPDLVHLNGYAHASLAWSSPVLVVAHSCVCSWWEAVRGASPPPHWGEYVRRVTNGLHAASAVVAPTAAMAAALRRHYRVDRDVTVILNCRDPRDWNSRRKQPLVFAAGRVWDPAKNLLALEGVADSLAWPVFVAGDAGTTAMDQVSCERVHLLGRRSPAVVARWMGRAAIYAFPARYEPFGLSILEAALSRCALVLGDIESLRENWSGAARFVNPGSSEELRRALSDLMANETERLRLGDAAYQRAVTFAPARHVSEYARVYHDIIHAHDRFADPARTL